MFRRWITHVSLFAGGLAAIGASACCVGPLLLVILGVGGAWGSRLTALASLRPFFIAVSLASFMFGFHRVRLKSATCASGDACTAKAVRRQRIIFWTVTPLAVALMAFPLYSPLFY
ncbi:mercuric transporter MerT family protein [Paraburkholderia bryophila]|uniref:Mercuric transport protein MerT n=1 Tax=Paraburkholderia bryophila TaxID=420952 RepID=A0A7Z0B3Z1_9BURK|nr:mercuric transporter MerT family protein [Paraburkholderia bryophila]NYH18802.1 mercuric ion transport protein [Paraburkholderia bryophila]